MTKTAFYPDTMKIADRVIILGQRLQSQYDRHGHASDTVFDVVEGRKYWKIKMYDLSCDGKRWSGGVHAFIDKKTGEVYKPASWKAPAKHVRYDLRIIREREECLMRADWAGGYLYLR